MDAISVVIPAYNEEEHIGRTLESIISYFEGKDIEFAIIVVDDGSTDTTNSIVLDKKDSRIRVVRLDSNLGKGAAVKTGLSMAKNPLVLITDSDLATPINEFEKMIDYCHEGYDIVIASRNMKGSFIQVKQPKYRQMMGRAFPYIVKMVALRGISDTQCGFKLLKRKVAMRISPLLSINGYAFDVEFLAIARESGFTIKEVPVMWVDKHGSKVSPLRDAPRMLWDLVRIRWHRIKGNYRRTR